MIRVLVVDDSRTARALLSGIIESDPDMQVVAEAANGADAVALLRRVLPDVVVMDVHMPLMDGLAATATIMATRPTPIVVVSSASNGDEVQLAMEAIEAGALTAMLKPDNPNAPNSAEVRREFLANVKAMADVRVVRRRNRSTPTAAPATDPHRARRVRCDLVCIGSSTGGPAALRRLLGSLPPDWSPPVLVVQHLAEGFAAGVASWLSATTARTVCVARSGEPLERRTVYLAPDEGHLTVRPDRTILLDPSPPVRGFRPSATVLFESAARVVGNRLVAVVLSGMGDDGAAGLRAVKAAGGTILAQDEESSVVYGMPKQAAQTGVVDAVLSLDGIAEYLTTQTIRSVMRR